MYKWGKKKRITSRFHEKGACFRKNSNMKLKIMRTKRSLNKRLKMEILKVGIISFISVYNLFILIERALFLFHILILGSCYVATLKAGVASTARRRKRKCSKMQASSLNRFVFGSSTPAIHAYHKRVHSHTLTQRYDRTFSHTHTIVDETVYTLLVRLVRLCSSILQMSIPSKAEWRTGGVAPAKFPSKSRARLCKAGASQSPSQPFLILS